MIIVIITVIILKYRSSKDWPVKPSLKTRRKFNPNSQAILKRILSDWMLFQRSTVRQCEKYQDDVRKYQ